MGKKEKYDGRSKPADDAYREGYERIFGQKENEELAESYKESKRQTAERTDPLKNFSEDLRKSIGTKVKVKDLKKILGNVDKNYDASEDLQKIIDRNGF